MVSASNFFDHGGVISFRRSRAAAGPHQNRSRTAAEGKGRRPHSSGAAASTALRTASSICFIFPAERIFSPNRSFM